jgi:iron complex transport system permease protein
VARARAAIIVAASLGTAAAVAVTGLIGFVGIIVPHIIRLIVGNSYRILLPLSVIYGGIFLVLADILARTILAPQEISIGVVTALLGAPFFLFVLGSSRNESVT